LVDCGINERHAFSGSVPNALFVMATYSTENATVQVSSRSQTFETVMNSTDFAISIIRPTIAPIWEGGLFQLAEKGLRGDQSSYKNPRDVDNLYWHNHAMFENFGSTNRLTLHDGDFFRPSGTSKNP